MEFNFKSFDNSRQSISYCEVDKCKVVIKLKKCLQEIKEIAEKAREDLYTCESIGYADDDLRAILQKISEVEDDN